MVTDDIHIYGTKGIDKIYVHEESCVLEDGKYKITLAFMVDTTSTNALNGSESKSLKIALPEASKNIVVTPDDKWFIAWYPAQMYDSVQRKQATRILRTA